MIISEIKNAMIDRAKLKSGIILDENLYYFDWTASGLAFRQIEDECEFILKTYSNTHSQCSSCAKITSDYYDNARLGLKASLELGDDFYLLPCGYGSTAAIKKFQELLGIYMPPATRNRLFGTKTLKKINTNIIRDFSPNHQNLLEKLPLVIVGPYEHHSNEISFNNGLCELYRVGLDEFGGINFDEIKSVLKQNFNREIILSFSAASNVTGIKTDVAKLRELSQKYAKNAIIAIDASSLSAYENINAKNYDALFISSHKLLGGVGGCGLLAIRKSLCARYFSGEPSFMGGGTVEYVSRTSFRFVSDFERLEDAGTPPIMALIRAHLAFKLRNDIGLENIKTQEEILNKYFADELNKIDEIICYCPKNQQRVAIFAFNVKGVSPYDFALTLSQKFGVQTRAGCACAGPYGHDLLGLDDNIPSFFKPGWIRVSLHYSHDFSDIDYLISAIKSSIKLFKNKI